MGRCNCRRWGDVVVAQQKLHPAALLGPTLQHLFEDAFVRGLTDPTARPSAQQWRSAIGRLFDRLVTCSNPTCVDRYFPVREGRPNQCPWCTTPLAIPGGVPALRLYSPTFRLEHDSWIAGYPGKTLHVWHRDGGGEPDPFAEQAPIARLELAGGTWRLVNIASPGLAELTAQRQVRQTIPIGGSVALTEGQILRLGAGPGVRYVLVQWIQ